MTDDDLTACTHYACDCIMRDYGKAEAEVRRLKAVARAAKEFTSKYKTMWRLNVKCGDVHRTEDCDIAADLKQALAALDGRAGDTSQDKDLA